MSKHFKGARLLGRILKALQPPRRSSWALVLEGGAMRCVFTAGVLDALNEVGHERFDDVIGVSARKPSRASPS